MDKNRKSFIEAYNDCLVNGTAYVNEAYKQKMYFNENQVEIEEKAQEYSFGVCVLDIDWYEEG